MKKILLGLILFSMISCGESKKEPSKKNQVPQKTEEISPGSKFVKRMEAAHQKKNFLEKEAVQFNITLQLEGEQPLDATVSMSTNFVDIKMEKRNGSILIIDKDSLRVFPAGNEINHPRFSLTTWAYFFAMPFKLTDPGTHWEMYTPLGPNKKNYVAAKLSLDESAGISTDNWYIMYADPQTSLLKATVYKNALHSTTEKAAENPRAIVYEDYISVKGVPVSTTWKFYSWSKEKGMYGEPVGTAQISNIRFFSTSKNLFKIKSDAKLMENKETPIL